jgi:hypothetical protein
MRSLLAAGLFLCLAACASSPPPHWQQGGAPLAVGPARWTRADDDAIEILPNGSVLENGSLLFLVDRAGRVVNEDSDPVAILLPDGQLVGPNDHYLGRVGVSNASPPGAPSAWLSILPNGQMLTYSPDGDREPAGVWTGCNGPTRRTCTLVAHMVQMRRYQRGSRGGVGVGIGIGIGY